LNKFFSTYFTSFFLVIFDVKATEINYGVDTRGKKKKRTSKKNVEGMCTSSHENKTFRSRSVVKQKGMVFGFRKTATAVTRPER
jgi:hypothetical protein